MYFNGDIIITDPCYIIRSGSDDWRTCGYGEQMEALGIKTYLVRSTEYGDWSCTTYESGKELGHFCADAGLVGVFLLEEVLRYNPNFDYHINREWTTTIIKGFDGDVEIVYRDGEVSVIGKGNVNFYTEQG
jgi:hypothetical protein